MPAILDAVEEHGEEAIREFALESDKWGGDIVVTPEQRKVVHGQVSQKLKDDICSTRTMFKASRRRSWRL